MNPINSKRATRNIGFFLSIALGLLIFSSISVSAQDRNDRDSRNRQGRVERNERNDRRDQAPGAYGQNNANGYYDRNGVWHPNNNGNQNANGYYDQNGVFHPYNNQGADGYYDQYGVFHPYGNYPNNGGYYGNNGYNSLYRVAQQNGFQDGLRKGLEDARERHNNPTKTSEYKKATSGYYKALGSKDTYKQAYRQAFLRGFEQGQNQYRNNGIYDRRRGY